MIKPGRSTMTDAAARLRALVLAREDGAFLGNEDALERDLGVSKPTVRQVARMLEREGLLQVRRGNAGGYFGARPDAAFIEATVATYLEVLGAGPGDLTRVATALWIETVRVAADAMARPSNEGDGDGDGDGRTGAGRAAIATLRRSIVRLRADAGFDEVQAVEQAVRRAVFDLTGAPYVELLFNINANYARRVLSARAPDDDASQGHRAFLAAWRKASLLLLDALNDGDAEVAVLAARRTRECLHQRLWPL